MKNVLLSRSLSQNSRWFHVGLFGIITLLCFFSIYQVHLWRMAATSATTLETNLSQAMQARLNAVSIGLLNYLQTQNPKALDQIKAQSLSAQEIFSQFKRESSPQLVDSMQQVETAHDTQRQSLMVLLVADSDVQETGSAFERRQQSLVDVLDRQLMGSMKPAMLQGAARYRSLLDAIADAKSMRLEYRADASSLTQTEKIQQSLLEFRRISSARQAPMIDEAQRQLVACTTLASQWFQKEKAKRSALEKFMHNRSALDEALENYARASRGMNSGTTATRQTYVLGFGSGLLALFLLALAAGFVWAMQRHIQRNLLQPMLELSRCMESAAAGDLTLLPSPATSDEVGRLSQAIQRTMNVMTRSENLVYHLAALVETSGDAIVSQSLDGTILSWNKGAQRLYGYSAEEVKGKSIALISPQDGGYQLRGLLQCASRGEKIPAFEAVHQAKNGRAVNAFVKMSAIYDSTHKVIGASLCAQELSPLGSPEIGEPGIRRLPAA